MDTLIFVLLVIGSLSALGAAFFFGRWSVERHHE